MLTALTTPEGIDSQIIVGQQVFLTMAGMDVSRSHQPFGGDNSIDSVLHYLGACDGTLILKCSTSVAFAFTARLMSIPIPLSFDDDVRDAMGELINMIGGNLKALLPAETLISPPTVLPPDSSKGKITHDPRLSRIEFRCECGLFRIDLYGNG